LEYAARYIVREVKKENGEMVLGTGGAPFMRYLTDHLKNTARMKFNFKYSKVGKIRGVVRNLLPKVRSYMPGLVGWLDPNPRTVDVEPQVARRPLWKTLAVWCILVAIFYSMISMWMKSR
jgi:hypothetical protein